MTDFAPTPTPPPVYAYAVARKTNGLAIAAFVLGLLGFAALPVILGHIALTQIKRTGDGGTAFAVIGLVLGYIAVALYTVLVVVLISGIGLAISSGNVA